MASEPLQIYPEDKFNRGNTIISKLTTSSLNWLDWLSNDMTNNGIFINENEKSSSNLGNNSSIGASNDASRQKHSKLEPIHF